MEVKNSALEPKPEFIAWLEGEEAVGVIDEELVFRLRLPSTFGEQYTRFELLYRGVTKVDDFASLVSSILLRSTWSSGGVFCVFDRGTSSLYPLETARFARAFDGPLFPDEPYDAADDVLHDLKERIRGDLEIFAADPDRAEALIELIGEVNPTDMQRAMDRAMSTYVLTGLLESQGKPAEYSGVDDMIEESRVAALLDCLVNPVDAASSWAERYWHDYRIAIAYGIRDEMLLKQALAEKGDEIRAKYGLHRSLYEALEPIGSKKVKLVFAGADGEVELAASRELILSKCLNDRPLSLCKYDVGQLPPSEIMDGEWDLDMSKLVAVRFRGKGIWRRGDASTGSEAR